MDYKGHKAIYLQIADQFFEKILVKIFKEGERLPSIRETAMNSEVNPNTVMRTYNFLQEKNIIYNKRGVGYFLGKEALKETKKIKKKEFLQTQLPSLVKSLHVLGIDFEELKSLILNNNQENYENK